MPRYARRRLLMPTLAAVFCTHASADEIIEPSAPHPPHVALIVCESLPRETLSAYGGTVGPDAFERFTSRAIVYEQAFSPHPNFAPALASAFTGLFETSHACRGADSPLPDDLITLAEALAAHGYRTLAVVPDDRAAEAGLLRGFAQVLRPHGRDAGDIISSYAALNALKQPIPDNASDAPERKVRMNDAGPVFLFVLLNAENGTSGNGDVGGGSAPLSRIAEWLQAIETRLGAPHAGESGKIVILTALRGSVSTNDEPSEAALRDSVLHIPLLATFPDARANRLSGLCQLVDLPATIYDQVLAWEARSGSSRGPRRCLVHASGLTLSPDEFRPREFVIATHSDDALPSTKANNATWRMVRGPSQKAIFTPRGEVKLFDPASDPDERRNLIEPGSPWAAKASSLEAAWRQWQVAQPSTQDAIRIRPRGIAD